MKGYKPKSHTHYFSNCTNSGECLTDRAPTQAIVFAYLQVIDRRFTSSINRYLDTSTKVYMELNGYLWPLIPPEFWHFRLDLWADMAQLHEPHEQIHLKKQFSLRWCGVRSAAIHPHWNWISFVGVVLGETWTLIGPVEPAVLCHAGCQEPHRTEGRGKAGCEINYEQLPSNLSKFVFSYSHLLGVS